jgi:hypothetical protein
VRDLATKLKTARDKGHPNPWIAVDLKQFLPTFSPDFVPVLEDEGGERKKKRDSGHRLEMGAWQMAWDRLRSQVCVCLCMCARASCQVRISRSNASAAAAAIPASHGLQSHDSRLCHGGSG